MAGPLGKSLDAHQTLVLWSQASDEKDLALKVGGSADARYEDISQRISGFLEANMSQLGSKDLKPLKELESVVHLLETRNKGMPLSEKGSPLELTIEKTVSYVQSESKKMKNVLPGPLQSLVGEYADITSLILLGLSREIEPSRLKNALNSKEEEEIEKFLEQNFLLYKKDPETSTKMIHFFYSLANLPTQGFLIRHVSLSNIGSEYVEHIILSLPEELTQLNLGNNRSIEDKHLEMMVKRLTHLTLLSLSNCYLVTDQGVALIANSPNMARLEHLALSGGDPAIKAIAQSPHMSNLKLLNLRTCYLITPRSISAITESPHMSNLRTLIVPSHLSEIRGGKIDMTSGEGIELED